MALLDVATAGLLLVGIVLAVPVAVLLVEIVSALAFSSPQRRRGDAKPRLAVLVPAHDEALVITETLLNIRDQLSPGDRLLVVADNCTDATAEIAENLGAEVVRRTDTTRRGKSYALDFGIRHLASNPPDVVIIVDADCALDSGCLPTIGKEAYETGRPVQAHYELLAPAESPPPRVGIAVFAAKVKNYLRALGFYNVGLPCQLMGTGMAFPWGAFSKVDLNSGELAEDLVLGLDLARAGIPPMFCPTARVTSRFPVSEEGSQTQRARWETGHLTTIARRVPLLLSEAITSRNWPLFALALDAAVPPLALHAMALAVFGVASLIWALLTGVTSPLILAAAIAAAFTIAVALAWQSVGRDNITLIELARAPAYAISKLSLYAQILKGKHISWIRSKRD